MPSNAGPMACPVDGTILVMSERSGIEIDYCPSCRGVWLDRGELDKIIERGSAPTAQQTAPPQQAAPQQQYAPQQGQQPWSQPQGQYGHQPHKKRKSFLEELFD